MNNFPRTTVGGVSLPRMIIGSNWFRGFSHCSKVKDDFIKSFQTRDNMADIITVFMKAGIDAIMSGQAMDVMKIAKVRLCRSTTDIPVCD